MNSTNETFITIIYNNRIIKMNAGNVHSINRPSACQFFMHSNEIAGSNFTGYINNNN